MTSGSTASKQTSYQNSFSSDEEKNTLNNTKYYLNVLTVHQNHTPKAIYMVIIYVIIIEI